MRPMIAPPGLAAPLTPAESNGTPAVGCQTPRLGSNTCSGSLIHEHPAVRTRRAALGGPAAPSDDELKEDFGEVQRAAEVLEADPPRERAGGSRGPGGKGR